MALTNGTQSGSLESLGSGGLSLEGLEAYEIHDVLERATTELYEAGNLNTIPATIGDLVGRQETSEGVAGTNACLQTLQNERDELRGEHTVIEATKVDFQIGLLEVAFNAGKLATYHQENNR
jgi:hypothetical protein